MQPHQSNSENDDASSLPRRDVTHMTHRVSVDPWSEEYVAQTRAIIGDHGCDALNVFALPADFCLTVVVPIYNEAGTVRGMVDRLLSTELPLEVIFVDDGSHDGSADQLTGVVASLNTVGSRPADAQVEAGSPDAKRWRRLQASLIQHPENRGKGAAIRTGLAAATGDVVVIQDADLEYEPRDLRGLLRPIVDGEADVVYGTRYGSADRHVSPWWHQTVNRMLTTLASIAIGPRLTDVETCYKMAGRELFQSVAAECHENRFGIEIELTARFARRKARFAEKAIRYRHRWYSEGKKIGWKDGVSALRCILVYGFLRR